MPADYSIEIEANIELGGVPSAVAALSFSSPKQYISVGLSDRSRVLLLDPGSNEIIREISIGDGIGEITPGGGAFAYAICRAAQSVDVFNLQTR